MKPEAIVELLRETELFETAEKSALLELAEHARQRTFKTNEALFHRLDAGSTLYVVISGKVKIETVTASGDTIHLALRGSGEAFGEMSLLDDEPRMADAVTVAETRLLMIEKADFLRAMDKHRGIARSLLRCLARRLREAAIKQLEHQELDVLGRLSLVILDLAKDAKEPGIINPLPSQLELATRVGCSRESVNRALLRIAKAGAINRFGKSLHITDIERLRRFAKA